MSSDTSGFILLETSLSLALGRSADGWLRGVFSGLIRVGASDVKT